VVARNTAVYKNAIAAFCYCGDNALPKETGTVITRVFSGRPARAIRNRFVGEYLQSDLKPLTWSLQALAADDIYKAVQAQGQADYFPLLAGQALRLLNNKGQSAAEIIALVAEDNKVLTGLKTTMT
jgi:nitronate monooxygenase